MTVIDLIQKHVYQSRNKKKTTTLVVHCCGTAPFVFSMNEKKKRLHFPKISGPTCRMNVMLIVTQVFLFFPEHRLDSIITSILFELVVGDKCSLLAAGRSLLIHSI